MLLEDKSKNKLGFIQPRRLEKKTDTDYPKGFGSAQKLHPLFCFVEDFWKCVVFGFCDENFVNLKYVGSAPEFVNCFNFQQPHWNRHFSSKLQFGFGFKVCKNVEFQNFSEIRLSWKLDIGFSAFNWKEVHITGFCTNTTSSHEVITKNFLVAITMLSINVSAQWNFTTQANWCFLKRFVLFYMYIGS